MIRFVLLSILSMMSFQNLCMAFPEPEDLSVNWISPGWEPVAQVMVDFMRANQLPSGALAVMKDDFLVVRVGLGSKKPGSQEPMPANEILWLTSNDKMLTQGVVQERIRKGWKIRGTEVPVNWDSRLVDVLRGYKVLPNSLGDLRMQDITLRHLLTHKSGMSELTNIQTMRSVIGYKQGEWRTVHDVLYIISQPLKFTPGEKESYLNSGYLILRYLVKEETDGDLQGELERMLFPCGETAVFVGRPENDYLPLYASMETYVRYYRRHRMHEGHLIVDLETGQWNPKNETGTWYMNGAYSGTRSYASQRLANDEAITLSAVVRYDKNQPNPNGDPYEALWKAIDSVKHQVPKKESVPRFWIVPSTPMAGSQATIYYDAEPMGMYHAQALYARIGRNGWKDSPDENMLMTMLGRCRYQVTITVPEGSESLEVLFTTLSKGDPRIDDSKWLFDDNHLEGGWTISLSATSNPSP